MIAAMDKNRAIGYQNQLLWKLPGDMEWFRQVTMNKIVVMGRKTFESIGRPLSGRINIVVSSNHIDQHQVLRALTPKAAIKMAERIIIEGQPYLEPEIVVIGGAQLYTAMLPYANKLYLTEVDYEAPEADAYFPAINEDEWAQTHQFDYPADEKNARSFNVRVLRKK